MRVRKKAVVLQTSLEGVQLKGPVKLVNNPNDFDESYLAKHEVKQESLPKWMRSKRGASVTLFYLTSFDDDGRLTAPEMATLGTIAAYGWVEQSPHLNPRDKQTAQEVFRKGSQYLAADLVTEFLFYTWATFEPASALRLWEVKRASKKLEAAALEQVRQLPSYRRRQAEYQAFLESLSAAYAKVDKLRARDARTRDRLEPFRLPTLPANWSVQEATGLWTVTGESAPGLLVGYFQSEESYLIPTTGVPATGDEVEFDGSLLVVWALDEKADAIQSVLGDLVPEQATGNEVWDFKLRAGISSSGGPPSLLFTAPWVNGALRPVDGQYTVDRKLMVRPAEFRKSAKP